MITSNIPTNISEYQELYTQSVNNPEQFWSTFAKNEFHWRAPWSSVLDYDLHEPRISWFNGAKLNITENCIDRHLADKANKTAILFEPNDPNEAAQHISYADLAVQVNKTANMLKQLGAKKGDRICIYMPMVPELAYAVLACARIGAIHSVVFAGFSAKSLSDRINDASCTLVLTADGGNRGSKITPLKPIVDEALQSCPTVEKVVVLERTKNNVKMLPDRDVWWSDVTPNQSTECAPEVMDAEDMLFILYTSGSTGKPKGMVHTCGGYMVYANYTFRTVFQHQTDDIYWCTADIGWITGHSYILYGPLSAGATTVMFEGVPSYPNTDRFWQIIEKHQVNLFYTAPTAIRALSLCEPSLIEACDLSSLRVLGTVGEPINEEAWEWYDTRIGKGNCPIVDTWWQTETGGIMISPIAGITPTIPTYATQPLPGIQPCLMDESENEILEPEAEGRLCIKHPWPGMARTIYGNHERFKNTYYSAFPGKYFTGDGARRDVNGNYRITGRVDDIVIVSGHNLGTAEIENAINEHSDVVESAVVGYPHRIKGNAICAFITLSHSNTSGNFEAEILNLISNTVGPIAKPERIFVCSGLPKTRSGKIMRRILRKIAEGEISEFGDISTLLNPECVSEIVNTVQMASGS